MIKKAILIVFVFALFAGCSNKLNLLAPYKEMVSVYGILDQNDPIQYIRVERVFLGAGNAYTMAQNQDSVYFQSGELTVTLERWLVGGSQVSVDVPATSAMEIVLTDTLMQADAGVFNRNERVYKTNHKLYADSTCQYKLIIHNNKTGKEFTAQTGLVGSFQLGPVPNVPNVLVGVHSAQTVDIVPIPNGMVYCYYNSPVNSGVCSLTMRLFYTETNGGSISKYVDLGLGTNYTIQTLGGEQQNFSYEGLSLLNEIAFAIPVEPIDHRTADSVQFILNAGGPDLSLYNQVNTSSSLSQNTPNYSNISGGVGIFSSRNQLNITRGISLTAKDTLSANSITCKLKFLDQNGNLSLCH